jgi:hypothetical protein
MDLPPSYGGIQGGAALRKGHVLILSYVNANPHPDIIAGDLLPHYSNYFLSRDSCRWRGHVPHYSKVIQRDVWPGIDVELRASEHGIETVYHIKPGADPSQIVLDYEGLDEQLFVDANGHLHLNTSVGDLTEQSPFAYQIQNRLQSSVPVQFRLVDENRYGFTLGSYDPSQEVVIDPLIYATPFPSELRRMKSDADSNKIVSGSIWGGWAFPTTPGSYEDSVRQDGFISKLNSNCNQFIFSSYFAGLSYDNDLVILPDGDIIISGSGRIEWPLTADAIDTTRGGREAGIAILSSDGSTIRFGTYLGGSDNDYPPFMDIDSSGLLYLCGSTASSDFTVTEDAMFPTHNRLAGSTMFLTVIDLNPPRHIVYSTYWSGAAGNSLGTGVHALRPGLIWVQGLDESCRAMPTTPDAILPNCPDYPLGWQASYFALVDIFQNQMIYATYYGHGFIMHEPMDSTQIWIAGSSPDTAFIFMPPGGLPHMPMQDRDAFLIRFELPNHPLYGTFLGGSNIEGFNSLHVEEGGTVIITGSTRSSDFPTTPDAFDRHLHSTPSSEDTIDLFLVRLTPQLDSMLYGTYIGGDWPEVPIDLIYEGPDRIWIAGIGGSPDFPYTPDAFLMGYEGSLILRFSLPPWSDAQNRLTLSPSSFSLSCYPNPFNPSTRIEFTLPRAGKVSLKVYDVLGREVAVLVNETLNARDHDVVFDGGELPSGIYFARLDAAGVSQTRKMVLLK